MLKNKMFMLALIICFLFVICACAHKDEPTEEINNYNAFSFSAENVGLYGDIQKQDSIVGDINELLAVFSQKAAVVDSSVSMFYKEKNGTYKPKKNTALIVVELSEKTEVMFAQDDASFDDVIKIIILPSQEYIGFENDKGHIRTYGCVNNSEAEEMFQKWSNH